MEKLIPMLVVCLGIPVAVAMLALLARRFIGCSCVCGRRATRFKDMTEALQEEVLAYFQNIEKRTPDTSGIFACDECEMLYDDFSGEKRSRDCDNVSLCKVCGYTHKQLPVTYLGNYVGMPGYGEVYRSFAAHNSELVDTVECLRCQRRPYSAADCYRCTADPKVHGCPKCFTLYRWTKVDGSRYKYLVPLTSREILKKTVSPMLNDL